MYNQYLASAENMNTSWVHNDVSQNMQSEPTFAQNQEPQHGAGDPETASVFSNITKTLSGRLHNIKLDMDTIIVLILVWFLLSDGDSVDWDLLVMIGIMIILGI